VSVPGGEPLQRWRQALAGWAVPACIPGARDQRPPPRRVPPGDPAQEPVVVPPGSRSFTRELEALPAGGTVLDVGAGAGGASLPLARRASAITGVDLNQAQLGAMAARGRRLGVQVTVVHGAWPQVAAGVPPADVVTCHHVLYAVHDLEPFAAALTSHAHRRVVVEIPQRHPQWPLNPLWARFHGLQRPDGPTAEDAFQALHALGLDPHLEVWVDQLGFGHYDSFDELVQRTRKRLLLPPQRASEVATALLDLGVDPQAPRFPGTVGRQLATIWWHGTAPSS
jgi:SAM-dependent methyltransferase